MHEIAAYCVARLQHLPPTWDREDVYQAAYCAALASGAKPSSELARLVHNVVQQELRREWKQLRRRAGQPVALVSVCGAQASHEVLDVLRLRLAKHPRVLEVLRLHLLGHDATSIAATLGLARTTVQQKYLWQIRHTLHQILEELQ